MNQLFQKLEASILSGRMLHAYLFAGNDHDSTDNAARAAASLVLYDIIDTERLKNEPDYMEYRGSITIGEFRDVIRPEIYRETYGKRGRVVVFLSAHLLSPILQNAMLKVIEEPPQNTHIILTGNEYGILPTIRSRCMIIRFSSPDIGELTASLKDAGASADEALQYSMMSGFVTARALRLLNDADFRELRRGVLAAFISSLKSYPDFKWSKVKRERTDFAEANEILLLACHDMMRLKFGLSSEFCKDIENELKKISFHFTMGQIGCIIDRITENAQRLATNASCGAAFDRLFAELSMLCLPDEQSRKV